MLPHCLRADLHCHSTCSDGTLSPAALAQQAHAAGIDLWALTDHDTLAGQDEACQAAQALGLVWVSGVEVSASWAGHTIHIVGLGVDTQHPGLQQLLQAHRTSRPQRAQAMAQQLQALGIAGAYAGALRHAGHPDRLSRTHLARYLVECGRCQSVAEVFRHYLSAGKPGYMPPAWAGVAAVVAQIRAAGGVAVLAHPARYKLSALQEAALFDAFAQAGGQALEVCTSTHSPAQVQQYAAVARQRGWAASVGSDFHSPHESRHALGQTPSLPRGVLPVWALLQARRPT
jgi:3',5'-nucleoside bisphosphate phosphatase